MARPPISNQWYIYVAWGITYRGTVERLHCHENTLNQRTEIIVKCPQFSLENI